MRVLGLDFETTGLNAKEDRIIEIGAVIWETESSKPLKIYSELIKPPGFVGLPEQIIKITGIEDQILFDLGIETEVALQNLNKMIEQVDYILAHNASFDKGFFEEELKRAQLTTPNKPWIDTMSDIPYAEDIQTRKLTYLAAEHGMVNPFSHRALFDTLTMLNILSKYEFSDVVERSASPKVEVIAHVSFDEKDKAKNLGFRWDGANKVWFRTYKKCDMDQLEFPFKITSQELSASI